MRVVGKYRFPKWLLRERSKVARSESGAAMAETAISLPLFLLLILGIMQLALLLNAKLLTNYAAYCAARAGIVHNGNMADMRSATRTALSPLFGRTDNIARVVLTSNLQARAAEAMGIIRVQRIRPGAGRFGGGYNGDFDDPSRQNENLLTVRVTLRYRMIFPIVDVIFGGADRRVDINSTYTMRMQSDRFTAN